jgi:hypothetical protein
VFLAGMIVAGFVSVPLLNLFTPLFATALMTRMMKRLAWTPLHCREPCGGTSAEVRAGSTIILDKLMERSESRAICQRPSAHRPRVPTSHFCVGSLYLLCKSRVVEPH